MNILDDSVVGKKAKIIEHPYKPFEGLKGRIFKEDDLQYCLRLDRGQFFAGKVSVPKNIEGRIKFLN